MDCDIRRGTIWGIGGHQTDLLFDRHPIPFAEAIKLVVTQPVDILLLALTGRFTAALKGCQVHIGSGTGKLKRLKKSLVYNSSVSEDFSFVALTAG